LVYQLDQRHGNSLLFDSANRLSQIIDPFGKTMIRNGPQNSDQLLS
jgi:hypothetical protein